MQQNSCKFLIGVSLSLLLLASPLAAVAQTGAKQPSDAKILAMGLDKWMAYYARMQGGLENEPMDREAMGIYQVALAGRDDAALRRLPPAQAQHLRRLRTALSRFHEDALVVAQDEAGGGTMYLDFMANAAVEDEEVVAKLIRTRPGSATAGQQKRMAARQAKTRQALTKLRLSPPDTADFSADDKARLQRDAAKLPHDCQFLQSATAALPRWQAAMVWDSVDLNGWLDAGGNN